MKDPNPSTLLNDPAVQELFAGRRKRYVALSAIVCAFYLAVAFGCAFAPAFMRQPIAAGSSISIAIASMAGVIVVAIVTSGYYTWWSNTVRDVKLERLKANLGGKS